MPFESFEKLVNFISESKFSLLLSLSRNLLIWLTFSKSQSFLSTVSTIFFLTDSFFIISLISTCLFLFTCLFWNAIALLLGLLRLDLNFSELVTPPISNYPCQALFWFLYWGRSVPWHESSQCTALCQRPSAPYIDWASAPSARD